MNVDAVVYVEGGHEHNGRVESYDILFWKKVFLHFSPEKRYRFLPRGGKSTLVELANNLVDQDIDGVFVAMDADYDALTGRAVDHPRVLYTYGYSWENDVWGPGNIERAFFAISPLCETQINISHQVEQAVEEFCKSAFWLSYADFITVRHGISVIPRRSPESLFCKWRHGQIPCLEKSRVRAVVRRVQETREGKIELQGRVKFELPSQCVGHFYKVFAYRYLIHILATFSTRNKVAWDSATSIVLSCFGDYLREEVESPVRRHYEAQFAR